MSEGSYDNPRYVRIKWVGPIRYLELRKWGSDHYDLLYVVYRARGQQRRTRLYIGHAYRQKAIKRLLNPTHKVRRRIAQEQGLEKLKVSIGEIKFKEGRRKSKRLIEEIENLLIYVYEPMYNKKKVWSYHGRRIVIRNSGKGSLFHKVVDSRDYVP